MGKQIIRRAINYLGWDIINYPGHPAIDLPRDASPQDLIILKAIAPFTMTSMARQMSLIQAVRYIAREKIPGAMVE